MHLEKLQNKILFLRATIQKKYRAKTQQFDLLNIQSSFSFVLHSFKIIIQQIPEKMGCQPSKVKINNPKGVKNSTSEEDPHIQTDELNHQIIPYEKMTNKACGYMFEATHTNKQSMESSTKSSYNNENLKSILTEYEKCRYFYNEHDLDRAQQHSSILSKQIKELKHQTQIPQNSKILRQLGSQKIQEMQKLINNVHQQYKDMIHFEEEIEKSGWVQKSNKKGVKISIRREADETVGCLIQSEIETPFEILISVLIEMDLYKQFIPFVKISIQEKQVARNCRLGYSQNHIPFLSVRQAFFQGIGYNRLDKNGSLFLMTRSIHNREDLQKKFGYKCNCNKQYVQLEYKYFVLKYQPLKRGKGKITIAMNVNPKLDFLPMWLLEKVSEDFGQDFLKNVLKMSKKFKGSKWQENVKKNPHLFNFFKNAIDDYLTQLQKGTKLPSIPIK